MVVWSWIFAHFSRKSIAGEKIWSKIRWIWLKTVLLIICKEKHNPNPESLMFIFACLFSDRPSCVITYKLLLRFSKCHNWNILPNSIKIFLFTRFDCAENENKNIKVYWNWFQHWMARCVVFWKLLLWWICIILIIGSSQVTSKNEKLLNSVEVWKKMLPNFDRRALDKQKHYQIS